LAERLQPNAKNLVVVAGSGKFDAEWLAFARHQLEQRTRQISARYLVGLPMQDLLRAVSTLPRDTIVVPLTYVSDTNDGRYTTPEVVRRIAAEASAPVYVPYDTTIGDGALGGYVRPSRLLGAELADVALEILVGTSATNVSPRITSVGRYRVDGRQLARWGLSAAHLPAGTEILFQPPSLWETHQGLATSALATILTLLCAVVFLVVYTLQRARRARAEKALTDSQRKIAFVADATNSGLWQMRSDDQPLWASNHCRTLFDLPADSLVTLEGLSKAIHADDRREFVRAMRSCARFGQPLHSEFRVVLSN
jgi:PAS domain-containing protein